MSLPGYQYVARLNYGSLKAKHVTLLVVTIASGIASRMIHILMKVFDERKHLTTLKRNHLVETASSLGLLLGFQRDPVRTNPTRQFFSSEIFTTNPYLLHFFPWSIGDMRPSNR